MMKNSLIFLPFVAIYTLQGVAQPFKKSVLPNVVIIYADDLGYGDVSCNGSTTIKTPNVDKLAENGIRFTNMHSSAATCTPSRYAMLTGEYAWRKPGTGIASGDAGAIIRPDRFTLANVFKSKGYKTAVVGKWHLGIGEKTGTQDWNGHLRPGPNEIGFDYSFILAATGDRVPCVYLDNQRVLNIDSSDPIYVSYKKNFDGEPTGKDNPELLKMTPSHGHDMAIVNGISRIGYMTGGKSALWKDEEIAEIITNKAVKFIEENKEKPFFLYFATHDCHVPRVPSQKFVGSSGMGPRGDAIMEFDWSVGEIIASLEKNGLDKNTIVILTSDNGPVIDDGYNDQAVELLGNHKPSGEFRSGKYSSFEGGTRVPGILSWSGTVLPGVSNQLVCQIDFLASFAAMLKVKKPLGAAPDSENHLKAFFSDKVKARDYLVLQNVHNNLSIINSNYKFIPANNSLRFGHNTNTEYGNDNEDQLYDLAVDIGERNNIAKDNQLIVDKLKNKLEAIKQGDLK